MLYFIYFNTFLFFYPFSLLYLFCYVTASKLFLKLFYYLLTGILGSG